MLRCLIVPDIEGQVYETSDPRDFHVLEIVLFYIVAATVALMVSTVYWL